MEKFKGSLCISTSSLQGTRRRLRALVARQNPESEDTDVEWGRARKSWNLQASFAYIYHHTWSCKAFWRIKWSCSVVSDSLQPVDCSPPGSSVHGILQARILEWVAISFSNAWKWKGKVKSLSHVRLFATPWTVACHAPPSMGFSRQEYWSGLPLPSPGDLPDPGIEPRSPALQADALTSEPPGKPIWRIKGTPEV